MKFLLRTAGMAVALWVASVLPLELSVTGGEDEWWTRVLVFLGIGVVLELMNAIIKPILNLISLPITILTLGFFALIINWFLLWLTAQITEAVSFLELTIGGFWNTFFAALVISIISALMRGLTGATRD